MSKLIFWDIETGPRPEVELHQVMPEFAAPSNYKDPIKIAEVITEKKNEWLGKAALCATTGTVLAIGSRKDGVNTIFGSGDEKIDLRAWWALVEQSAREGAVMVGFNIARFDVPFLVRRSWYLGVPVPVGVYNGRFLNHHVFLDLYEHWQCGNREVSISLKRLSEFLGVGTKDKDGALAFAEKWVTDRKAALEYLENDLVLTEAVALKLIGAGPSSSVLPTFVTPVPTAGSSVVKPRRKKAEAPAEEAPAQTAPVPATAAPVAAQTPEDDCDY